MPITWRNVDAPSAAPAFRAMESAGEQVNAGLNIFNKVLQQRQAFVTGAENNAQEVSKQAYLDRLQSATTPEEVAALQASGELDGMTQGMRPDIRGQLRGAADARLTSTRQAVTAANAYDEGVLDQEQRPIREQVAALTASGKFEEARALAIGTPNLRGMGVLMNGITVAERSRVTQGQADEAASDANRNRDFAFEAAQLAAREAEGQRVEGQRQRGLTTVLNDEVAGYQARTATRQAEAGPLFQSFEAKGIKDADGNPLTVPRNADGSVNYAAIGTGLRGQLEDHLAENNSYTLDELMGSDTRARREVVEALKRSGATATDLARMEPVLATGLNTTPQALTGNDLAAAQRAQRIEDASLEQAASQYVPLNNPAAASAVANATNAAINERFGGDTWRAENLRKAADKFLREGIVPKDEKGNPIKGANGQPMKVIPSSDTMLRLLDTMDSNLGWFGIRNSASDLEEAFENYLKDPEVYRGAAAAVDANLRRSIRSVNSPAAPK